LGCHKNYIETSFAFKNLAQYAWLHGFMVMSTEIKTYDQAIRLKSSDLVQRAPSAYKMALFYPSIAQDWPKLVAQFQMFKVVAHF